MRSVRLHLDKQSKKPPSSSQTTTSGLSSWSDGEPRAPPLPLSIFLRGLMAEAEALHDRVDFATFINIAETRHLQDGQLQWKCVERSPTFTMLKREEEVLALARLDASVEEVVSALGATTDELHTATMKSLYGDTFISGSVAYVHRPHAYEDNAVYQQLTVKTSSFVHSGFFGKNEQWCYAETLRRNPDDRSFKLTQGSLPAYEAQSLPARQAIDDNKRRVAQLRDVTAALLVERVSQGPRLRVTFHALHQPVGKADNVPIVSRKAARARLLLLARSISEISQLVRRRRFGAQVFANHSAFDVRNSRCTCCTRKLTFFVTRTRCYLCGYYVCELCSSSEKMETYNGRLASIVVCTRCVKSVVACDYEQMLTVRPGPERVLPDSPSSSEVSSFADTDSSSQKLGELLTQIVDDDSDAATSARRRAAFLVLEQLLLCEQQEAQVQADKNAKLLHEATDPSEIARRVLDISKYPKDPEACKFASAESRPYPMLSAVVGNQEAKESIIYPIPANEDVRLAAIEHFCLHEIANVPELNVVCTLAAAEMNCPHSVVTLVEKEVVTLLATNDPENWDAGSGNPREQTFCQHFVMDDKPLLVRHAESDMRFYHIAPVVLRSLRFYAGFPVSVTSVKGSGTEKVVVGALCCLDAKPHEMTRTQYWRLTKLAEAASEILERHAKEFIASPRTCTRNCQTRSTAKANVAVAC
ncbi:hypothetical protein V7S43_018534 [Phytophthora oleae]|uniref:FYVE-type domain-containing protein n=1 Tax=Phytophthora oleae TaxID=2107226 RepID=A0ABD3EUC4_9STRA